MATPKGLIETPACLVGHDTDKNLWGVVLEGTRFFFGDLSGNVLVFPLDPNPDIKSICADLEEVWEVAGKPKPKSITSFVSSSGEGMPTATLPAYILNAWDMIDGNHDDQYLIHTREPRALFRIDQLSREATAQLEPCLFLDNPEHLSTHERAVLHQLACQFWHDYLMNA